MTDKPIIVCMSVNDMPIADVPATLTDCMYCHTVLWKALTSPDGDVICRRCAARYLPPMPVGLTNMQREELRSRGFTDQQIDDLLAQLNGGLTNG